MSNNNNNNRSFPLTQSERSKLLWENRRKNGWVSSRTGTKHTEETKKKMKEAWERRRERNWSYRHTPEQLERLKNNIKNSPLAQEALKRLHESNRGKKRTPEQRIQLSKTLKTFYAENPDKIRRGYKTGRKIPEGCTFKGRRHTEEALQKLREASTGRKMSDEVKAKMRETRRKKMELKIIEMRKLGFERTSYGWRKIKVPKVKPPVIKKKRAVKEVVNQKPSTKREIVLNEVKWMDVNRIFDKISKLSGNTNGVQGG